MEDCKQLITTHYSPFKAIKTMKLACQFLLASQLLIPAFASAHILLSSDGATPPRNHNGVSCGAPDDNFAVFTPGSRITVDYFVQVKHGDTIRIDFAEADDMGFEKHVLAEMASHYGAGQKMVTLPNIECDACTLRIQEGGYTSCADIRLKAPAPMMADTTPPEPGSSLSATATGDTIYLSWQNPTEDFAETLWLMSDSAITALPMAGHSYVEGEILDGAKVVYIGDGQMHTLTGAMANSWVYLAAFSRDEAGNYSMAATVDVRTGEAMPAPLALNVAVMQANILLAADNGRLMLDTAAGDVLVQAQANHVERTTVTWQVSDTLLMNTATAADEFIFDAGMLSEGEYSLTVTAILGDEQVQQHLTFVVMPEPAVQASSAVSTDLAKGGGSLGWVWLLGGLALFGLRRQAL